MPSGKTNGEILDVLSEARYYNRRCTLRTPCNHLHQQFCRRFRYRYVSHFIDHNEIKACPALGQTGKGRFCCDDAKPDLD
jgi:hypothetical protein